MIDIERCREFCSYEVLNSQVTWFHHDRLLEVIQTEFAHLKIPSPEYDAFVRNEGATLRKIAESYDKFLIKAKAYLEARPLDSNHNYSPKTHGYITQVDYWYKKFSDRKTKVDVVISKVFPPK